MKQHSSLLKVGSLVSIASALFWTAPAFAQATCDTVLKCSQKAVDAAASADATAKTLQDRVDKLETLTKRLDSQVTGGNIYQCPTAAGHDQGSLGGGSWGFYGCQGQVTTQATCAVIEFAKRQDFPCTLIGKLRIAPP